MHKLVIDPIVKAEKGAAARALAQRLNRFENKNTWWRHSQNGTLAEFDRQFEEAVVRLRQAVGQEHPLVIDGHEVRLPTFETRSPAESALVVGKWANGRKEHAQQALQAAKAGFPAWSATPWQDRCALLDRTADLFTRHFYDLCAVMSIEAGKTRFEASIDVDEAIDFLRYYALQMREMDGFDVEMGQPFPGEHCRSVRKPWGVFSVVCPFNFPVAITTGMTAAALVTGNTAVLKPSGKGCLSGWWVFRLFREAGAPASALHFLTGGDHAVSTELLTSPEADGLVFTGSKRIGMMAWQKAAEHGRPKPVIAEMGGKNAIVISDRADLDKAVQGVFRSAFGFQGQKCSACSRVYVHAAVAEEFMSRLVRLTEAARVGHPWQKESFMGPVIEAGKARLLAELVAQVRKDGGEVLAGGEPTASDGHGARLDGNYLRPTIVSGLPADHRVFREEFFMPFVAIRQVASFEEGIEEANAAEYGLTSGCFTEDPEEQRLFLERIQVGVAYVNRAAGGSTAAVVNGQAFGGWKNSGSTGNGAGGRYYLTQFTREQSQTVVS